MNNSTNNKGEKIKAVELKNRIQEEIVKEIEGLSNQEQLQYFRQPIKDSSLQKWWEQALNAQLKQNKKVG